MVYCALPVYSCGRWDLMKHFRRSVKQKKAELVCVNITLLKRFPYCIVKTYILDIVMKYEIVQLTFVKHFCGIIDSLGFNIYKNKILTYICMARRI